jgi:hypothetical protein
MSLWIAIPYYNYRYAQRHGFLSWLIFGEVVATSQAMVWPVFVFKGSSKPKFTAEERDNLEHYHKSRSAFNQMGEMWVNAKVDSSGMMYDSSEIVTISTLLKRALDEAKQVNLGTLAKVHPDLPDRSTNEYIPCLEVMHRVLLREISPSEEAELIRRNDEFSEWCNLHRMEFKFPK